MIQPFWHLIAGWTDQSLLDLYTEAVKRFPTGSHFVEVGIWQGRSTAFLATEILNAGKVMLLDAVDTWKGSANEPGMIETATKVDLFSTFWRNMVNGGVSPLIRPVMLPSVRASRCYDDGELDFVFIDAAHDEASVRADIAAWLPKVKRGSWLCGHDYDSSTDPGVVAAVDALLPQRKLHGRCWKVEVE